MINPRNARRGYRERVARRARTSPERQKVFSSPQRSEKKMNTFWRSIVVVALVCMTVLCLGLCVFSYFVMQPNTTTVESTPIIVVATPKIILEPTSMVNPQNPIPYAQAETCVGITANADQSYVEKTLVPGQTMAGDIEIFIDGKWVQVHDSGIGEYTVVRNTGTTDVLTRGRWGAGCLLEVNQKIVVNGEFSNPNHSDLVRVRDVAVNGNSYVETMFTSPLP